MRLLQELRSDLNRLYLFELDDGLRVESVFYRGDTLCISSQVGCAIGCPFCLSGSKGLFRNLSYEEIYLQYKLLKERLPIKRIAIAGIGEPLMNYQNVEQAFWAFKKDGVKVSFYTTGFPTDKLLNLLNLPHNGITISIHTLDEEKRKYLLPHAGSLKTLLDVLKTHLRVLSKRKKKKIGLAYLLLKGINDSQEELLEFAKLVKALGVNAVLLYYNTTNANFVQMSPEEYEKHFFLLKSQDVRVTLSTRYRKDKLGGCGTLLINRSL
ncbi:radical SAM protein [Thermocrinis sp.]|uniref:radical SAM protein n=1 Tax=Thermocrinis sp. TaxID=2024383 RepID=UPI002FDED804